MGTSVWGGLNGNGIAGGGGEWRGACKLKRIKTLLISGVFLWDDGLVTADDVVEMGIESCGVR